MKKESKDLELAPIKWSMMKSLAVKKKIKKAKKKKEGPKDEKMEVWEKENPMSGKKGAIKSLKYFRDAYKKNPNSERKKHLKESLDFYKKKFPKKKGE